MYHSIIFPLTHPIQASQILHFVLITAGLIVDDGVLLVYTARLQSHTDKSKSYEPQRVFAEHYHFMDLLFLEASLYAATEVFYLVATTEFEGDISYKCNIPKLTNIW